MVQGDFDGDGQPEIMASELEMPRSVRQQLAAYDAQTGEAEWRHNQSLPDIRAIALADVDRDGQQEFVLAPPSLDTLSLGTVLYRFDSTTLTREYKSAPRWLDLNVFWTNGVGALALADIRGDGGLSYIVGSGNYKDTLRETATVTVADADSMAIQYSVEFYQGARVSALATGDVDGDGALEIVAGMHGLTTGGTGSLVYILDAASGRIEWQSVSSVAYFTKTDSIHIGNVDSDPAPEIVVSGGRIRVYDVVNDEHLTSEHSDYLGLALALPDTSGKLRIVAGAENGRVDVISSNGTNLLTEATSTYCSEPVHAIVPNTLLNATPSTVLIACDTELATLNPFTDSMRKLSRPLGNRVGNANHIFVYDDSFGRQRVAVSTSNGIQTLEPVPALAPYVKPYFADGQGLAHLFMHWRNSVPLYLDGMFEGYGDAAPELSVAPVEIDGTLTRSDYGTNRFEFTPDPTIQRQYVSLMATDPSGLASNVGSIAIYLTNSPPRSYDETLQVEQGAELRVSFVGNDQDYDPITFRIVTEPSKGELTEVVENEYFVYRSAPDAEGVDIVEYVVDDSFDEARDLATVTIEIQPAAVSPPPPPPPGTPPPSAPPTASEGGGGGATGLWFLALLPIALAARNRRGVVGRPPAQSGSRRNSPRFRKLQA